MIPDAEKITANYLREELDARVVATTPADKTEPWVRLTMLAATDPSSSRADHLISFLLQFDCYAGAEFGLPEATTLARTVREALREMPEHDFDDAVVSAARFAGFARIPDKDGFEKARERIVVTASVWMHSV